MRVARSVVFVSLLAVACGEPAAAPDAGDPVDAGSIDAGAIDAGSDDAGAVDAGAVDAGDVDAGALDAGATDAGAIDAGAAMCGYVGVDDVVVSCGGEYRFVSRFIDGEGSPDCPEFYGFSPDGARFDGFDAAIASDPTCDATCVYRFATSVTRLYCGRRTGYETLAAAGCPELYRFAEGYFSSVEAHDAAHPCP